MKARVAHLCAATGEGWDGEVVLSFLDGFFSYQHLGARAGDGVVLHTLPCLLYEAAHHTTRTIVPKLNCCPGLGQNN